jgi:hypothetical protein
MSGARVDEPRRVQGLMNPGASKLRVNWIQQLYSPTSSACLVTPERCSNFAATL